MNIIGAFPIVITNKLKESQDFYSAYFGFSTVYETNWYIHLRHVESNIEIGFMIPELENQPMGLRAAYNGKGTIFSLETDNATQCYKELQKKGLSFVLPLKDETWGQRHCIIEDPSGMHVDIVEQLS